LLSIAPLLRWRDIVENGRRYDPRRAHQFGGGEDWRGIGIGRDLGIIRGLERGPAYLGKINVSLSAPHDSHLAISDLPNGR
jgi:hypothetical protein